MRAFLLGLVYAVGALVLVHAICALFSSDASIRTVFGIGPSLTSLSATESQRTLALNHGEQKGAANSNLNVGPRRTAESLANDAAVRAKLLSLKLELSGGSAMAREYAFVQNTMIGVHGTDVELMGGSAWRLDRAAPFALPAFDVVIVLVDVDHGIACFDGNDFIEATRIKGNVTADLPWIGKGFLTKVAGVSRDGSMFKLGDGTLLSVSQFDQSEARSWLSPFLAIYSPVSSHVIKLANSKRVRVHRVPSH